MASDSPLNDHVPTPLFGVAPAAALPATAIGSARPRARAVRRRGMATAQVFTNARPCATSVSGGLPSCVERAGAAQIEGHPLAHGGAVVDALVRGAAHHLCGREPG